MSSINKKNRSLMRVLALLLCACMCLTACVSNPTPNPTDPDPTTVPTNPTTNPTEPTTEPTKGPDGYLQEGVYTVDNKQDTLLNANGLFYTDYTDIGQAYAAGQELNIRIAEEGMVLLKNENGALPLSSDETRVTALGYRSSSLQLGGGGSGAIQTGYLDAYGLSAYDLHSSLEAVGIKLNPAVEDYYSSLNSEVLPENYPQAVLNSYREYNDAAIIVFSRSGSEGSDLSSTDNAEGKHSLQLTNAEEAVIRHAKENFDKVIVLLNAGNCMEVAALQEPKTADNLGVDAILLIGHVGVDGAAAIGSILTGAVNPSGHTVDIWESNFRNGPAFTNFGTMAQNGTDETSGAAYDNRVYLNGEPVANRNNVEYREDIYMGYKFYETVYADRGNDDAWYDEAVVYPFGFGLSYTTFDWQIDEIIAPTATISAANSTVTIMVTVTNIGDVAGKDVVQVYVTPPYYDGGIEKAEVNLVGFAKTDLLQPGESQTVTVVFAAQDMASFDWDDRNGNGFYGYELEAGEYVISVRSDSHTVEGSVIRTVEETILCETDLVTGAPITAVFSQIDGPLANFNTTNEALLNNLLSREGGLDGTAPAPSTMADRTVTQADVEQWNANADAAGYNDDASDLWYISAVPDSWTQESSRVSGTGTTPIQLKDMAGVPYTNPTINADGTITLATDEGSQLWEQFMNQLTWEEMEAYAMAGGWGRRAIPALGVPEAADQDGPNQLGTQGGRVAHAPDGYISRGGDLNNGNGLGSGVAFISEVIVASTWNTDLAAEEGRIMGNFGLFLNISGWYGPGLNIHRSPFGGRNFEYYSEDGVLAGKMAGAVIGAASEKGLVCYPKHLGLNEQETSRSTVNSWATEQALREIYLKPYELAVKEGGAMGFMTAMGNIGYWAAHSNGAMMNNLFRDEWGFKGVFITDANGSGGAYKTLGIMLRNGNDINLARATMITSTLGADATIINAEATVWNPDARNGKGMVMVAPDAATRAAGNVAIHTGWTEGIGGTTEFKFYNWRDKSVVADQLTVESATYYYWLRQAVQHSLYITANSNTINNGAPTAMYYGDIVVDDIAITASAGSWGSTNLSSTVIEALGLEDGVVVTDCYIATDLDLPAYATSNIPADVLAQLVAEGKTEILSNANVPTTISINSAGEFSIGSTPAGTYEIIVVVETEFYHNFNVRVTLTIE